MRRIISLCTSALLAVGSLAAAQTSTTYYQPVTSSTNLLLLDPYILWPYITWTCKTGSGATCTSTQLSQPDVYRQILVFPSGYTDAEKSRFFADADTMRIKASDAPGTQMYTEIYRDRLLWISYWVSGGDLGTATSAFGGKIFAHPVRGEALTQNQDSVFAKVASLQASSFPQLRPGVVVTVFDSPRTDVTANAAPPSFLRRSYGVCRVTAGDANEHYTPAHEIGHALINWIDEYIEDGFENMSITQIDALTPLAIWNGGWDTLDDALGDLLGIYDINISEILANNGNDNVATSRYPATASNGLTPEVYEYQGGMFFGKGTWHDTGKNLMNSNRFNASDYNGFAYEHSPSQDRVLSTVFDTRLPGRGNDRLRNAGPVDDWPFEFGSTATVMLFDGDKNHRWHPTQKYNVLVGWYERVWDWCYVVVPCYTNEWRTYQKTVYPSSSTVELKSSTLYGLANLAQGVVCGLGIGDLIGGIDLCTLTVAQMADAFIPTMKFPLPYQYTTIPTSQGFTNYYWTFHTYNGRYNSNWTGWSSFYRSF